MKKLWLVKAGGELMGSASIRKKILQDLKVLARTCRVVFVHGGGPQIEKELIKNKIPVKFVGGRRFTSEKAMDVIEGVLSGVVNKSIVGDLLSLNVKAVGISCRDGALVQATPLPNLGRAAKPIAINPSILKALTEAGFLPVVSSVGADQTGRAVNINADDAASALAVALKAQHLVFLTNITGVKDQNKKTIRTLKVSAIDALIKNEVITGGMIPKVQSARKAIEKGVGEINIVNGTVGVRLSHGTAIKK